MKLIVRGAAIAAMAGIALTLAGCQKPAAPASNDAANVASSTSDTPPAAPVSAVADANLPPECKALLTALQACSDRLTAANAPGAAQYRAALDQTRAAMPAAASDPGLAAQCTTSLKAQNASAQSLGC